MSVDIVIREIIVLIYCAIIFTTKRMIIADGHKGGL